MGGWNSELTERCLTMYLLPSQKLLPDGSQALARHGRKSLEIPQGKDSDHFDHGETGDNYISDIQFQVKYSLLLSMCV